MAKKAQVDVTLNGEEAKARLKEIGEELKKLKALKDKFLQEGNASGVDSVNKEMKKLNGESAKLNKNITDVNDVLKNLSTASIQELNAALRVASRELNQMKRSDPGFADQEKKVIALRQELEIATGRAKEHQSRMTRLADGFNKYFAMATTFIGTITGVVLGFKKLSEQVAHLDDVYSDVMKTTQLTRDEVVRLNEEFKRMDTRTSRENLNKLASEAGKLGIEGKKNILEFVDAGNQINVALGEDLGEGAIVNIGKMVGVFEKASSELQGLSLKEKMLAVGSAINDIGASSSASEPYLINFSARMGGIAKQAGISLSAILGYASALDQDMQAVEMSSTAFSNFIMKLMADPAKFAQLARLEVKSFTSLLNTDANAAIKQVLSGLNQQGGFQALVPVFQEMGLEGSRAVAVLSSMAGSMDKIDAAQQTANQAMIENISITNEYNLKNNNLQAKLEKARKEFQEQAIALGEKLNPAILVSTNSFTVLLKLLVILPDHIRRNQSVYIALTGAVLAYNAAMVKSALAKSVNWVWDKNLLAQWIRNTVVLNTMVAAEKLKTIWTAQGTVATKAATTAQLIWNAAMKANPLGLVIMGITALISAIKLYDKYNAESIRLEKEKKERIEAVKTATDNLNSGNELRQKLISELNTMTRDQIVLLADQTSATLKQAEADLQSAKAKQLLTQQENTRASLWQKFVNFLGSANNAAVYAAKNVEDAVQNGLDAGSELQEGIDALGESIQQLKEQNSELNKTLTAEFDADQIQNRTISQMEEKLRLYQVALKAANVGSEEYIRIQKKISDTNTQLSKTQQEFNRTTAGEVEKQIGAYQKLTDSISELEKEIKDLVAANKPVPDSLIHQLTSKKEELKQVEEVVKKIGQGIALLSAKKAGFIPQELPTIDGTMVERSGHSEVNIGEKFTPEEKNEREQAAIEIANTTQNAIFDIVRNKQQAEFDHKMSLLERQRDAELSNEKLTEEQRDKIREKYRKKEAALKLEQWKKQKAADIVQGIIKGALAVITAMAQNGLWAAIPAGVAAAAEIAVIASQKPPEFKSGGFTSKSMDDDTPAGEVHANEFVANAQATRNPSVRKVLTIIDYAQRTGAIRTINLPAVIASSQYERKLKAGGFVTSPIPVDPINSVNDLKDVVNEFRAAVNDFKTNGIKVEVEADAKLVYQDFKIMQRKEEKAIQMTS